jgi:hypothetical protein
MKMMDRDERQIRKDFAFHLCSSAFSSVAVVRVFLCGGLPVPRDQKSSW